MARGAGTRPDTLHRMVTQPWQRWGRSTRDIVQDAQNARETYRMLYEWGGWWEADEYRLGVGTQPPQAPITLDSDAPLLRRHGVPAPAPAPTPTAKPKPKPKPPPRPAGARAAAMLAAPQPAAPADARAVPRPTPRPALTWDRMAAWEGAAVQPSAAYQCPYCPTRVTLPEPLPPGRYRIICPQCIYGFDGAVV